MPLVLIVRATGRKLCKPFAVQRRPDRAVLRSRRENEVDQVSSDDDPRTLLVSATHAARVLAIGRTTLYESVKSGDLTPIHIRRCVRFSMYEITQYVESLARQNTRAS